MHSKNVKSYRTSSAVALILLGVAWFAGAAPVHAQGPAGISAAAAPTAPPSIEQFVKLDAFEDLKISPTGEYLAATAPVDNKTVLIILRRRDMVRTGLMVLGSRTHVYDFWWVNDNRVLLTTSEENGSVDTRYLTGEIYGLDADGKNQSLLVGIRSGSGDGAGTRIKSRKQELVAATMVDDLRHDDDHVLVAITPLTAGEEPFTKLDRMHVRTGARTTVARAPVRNAQFVVDGKGVARFAQGAGSDRNSKLFYRARGDAGWELLNDESKSGVIVYAIGFSPDGRTAYLEAQHASGPNAFIAFDAATRRQTVLVRDTKVDPYSMVTAADGATPIAVRFLEGQPRLHYIDDAAPDARLLKSLEKSFPGHSVNFTGFTKDGNLALVYAYSDRNPGDFYLFDRSKKEATHLASRREWVDPERMAAMRSVWIRARDGRMLHGYLTTPPGSDGKNLPLVINPHGGPFGPFDVWAFDTEPQLLASRGYAVLQVNFRGSGNYGREHLQSGYRQWGLKMQDDLVDATQWAITEGVADKNRICIYGASYGGYAALMGVAREPDLYRCAIGYVGVYDLNVMHAKGDIRDSRFGRNFLAETLGGNRERLAETSPTRLASKIKVPVFLAAGGSDERAPIKHSEMMRDALIAAGNKPEWLAYTDEGHGFEQEPHKVEYYTKLLAFLDRNIGSAAAE